MKPVWPIVHEERAALIDDLVDLDAQQWEQQSLCDEWSIHDVLAHLVDTAMTTRLGFLTGLVRTRFDFDRQDELGVRRHRHATPAQTLERFRDVAQRTSSPPAHLDSRLVEEIVHGEDIRRPLGITRCYPREAVSRGLQLQARTPASFGGAKELLTKVHITATDDGTSLGQGPEASGTTLSLLLAISGRRAALDDLDGPGTAALAELT